MNIVTGVFRSVDGAKDAFTALQRANFSEGDIGLVACDREVGQRISSDLGRDFRPDTAPDMGVGAVSCKFSDQFTETIRLSDMPDDAIGWYRKHLDNGHILVIVQAGNRMNEAGRIIHDHDGILYPEKFSAERATTRPEMRQTQETRATTPGAVYVPIIEEEVYLEKSTHEVGEVEVTSETTSKTVDVPTTVMREEVHVERRTLERPMTVEEYQSKVHTESGTVHMTVAEEELRVMKKLVVREEIIITRVPVQESKTVREEVHRTEPRLETTGDVHIEKNEIDQKKRRPAA